MTKPTVSDERLAEMVGAGMPCVPIMAGEVAQVVQELRQRRAQQVAPVELHGPYGWLNGHRALNEENWTLEMDPLENSEEYFAIPLYALSDPFKEIGRDGPPDALSTKPEANGDQCDKCHRRYTAVYSVPNDLWTKIAPKPETLGDYPEHQYGGLLCPDCATDAAKALGVNLVLATQPPTPTSGEPRHIETRNDEAGFTEFVNQDGPTVVREIDGLVAILFDMDTRDVVGYRVYDAPVASGEQMEVVGYGHKAQDGHIDALALVPVHGCREPLVTLEDAQKAITAANERAERLERELTRRHEDLKDWKSAHRKEMGARAAAEALNTTLSEALEKIRDLDDGDPVPSTNSELSMRNIARTALAALPAKQGGQS
ncbi:MAG: hypothetical protein CML24_11700 [Rhizobiales bacterium]|nr:hypothetical protein [Hyphomicrobiales bacterium]|tara:strand:- start:2431 stop:3546 length:1116 start_codon:yes stop_codon:yes gene_type:complete